MYIHQAVDTSGHWHDGQSPCAAGWLQRIMGSARMGLC